MNPNDCRSYHGVRNFLIYYRASFLECHNDNDCASTPTKPLCDKATGSCTEGKLDKHSPMSKKPVLLLILQLVIPVHFLTILNFYRCTVCQASWKSL